jgi:hypothetical protein
MKYLDLLLVKKRGAVDAAAGTYFFGRRPADVVARESVAALNQQGAQEQQRPLPQYKGLIHTDVRAFR